MKRIVPIIMMLAAMTAMAQQVQLRFTAVDKEGNYHAFQKVKVADLNQGWELTLTYPDTVVMLSADGTEADLGIKDASGLESGLEPNYPNPFKGHTESVLRLDESGMVTMRLVRIDGAVEWEKSGFMEAGDYRLGVDVSGVGMSYLQVLTPSKSYVTKMVNMQSGGATKVEAVRTAMAPNREQRKDIVYFNLGDMMNFRAINNQGGAVEYSNAMLRTQLEDETITLQFTTVDGEECDARSFATEERVFMPDGPNCGVELNSTLEVTGFPQGMTIQSVDEIASVCVKYEHSFMGDYSIKLICPNGREAMLKDASSGSSLCTGYPYGGVNDAPFDAMSNEYCDPLHNMYGVGLDYCFSRNADYLLVDGQPANTTSNGQHYLWNNAYVDTVVYTFDTIPEPFYNSGQVAENQRFTTKHPSNRADKLDYYRPSNDFEGLVGCPLNGTWTVHIKDVWACDNGWFFGWSMELAPNCGK